MYVYHMYMLMYAHMILQSVSDTVIKNSEVEKVADEDDVFTVCLIA